MRAKILIVDDSPTGRETLRALLLSPDYELHFAVNGHEALEKAAEVDPDLILLDVMMPDMDGFEVCERLRRDKVLAEVPVIMVTALDDHQSRLQGIRAGADGFISKPFDTAELSARVQMILRLNRYRRLHAERRRFEQIIQFSPDGIVILDRDGRIQQANRTLLKFLHADDEQEIVGRGLTDFLFEAEQNAFSHAVQQVADGDQETIQCEIVLVSFDATLLSVEAMMGRFEWEERNMVQVTFRDLSQRNLAEAALRESERRYRNIFDNAPVAIFEEDFYEVYVELEKLKRNGVTDIETFLDVHPEFVQQMAKKVVVLDLNTYARKMYFNDDEGDTIEFLDTIFLPESMSFFKKELMAIANGDRHYEEENLEMSMDGSLHNVIVSIAFPKEPEQFHKVLVSVVDITEFKQTVSALRESEDRYYKMMQMANDAIVVTDPENFQIVDVNEKAQSLLGMDREAFLTRQLFDIYPAVEREHCKKFYGNALDEDMQFFEACQIVGADGALIDVEITNSRIELGNRTLLMGIFRDVTDRREQERVRDVLLTVSIELRRTENYDEVLPNILEQILVIMNAEGVAISRNTGEVVGLDRRGGSESHRFVTQWDPKYAETRWIDERPFEIYSDQEQRLHVPWLRQVPEDIFVLESPLMTSDEVLGSLWVGRKQVLREKDGRILANFADLIANAIQRKNFLDELERRLEYLQALFTLDRAIAGSLDLDLIFKVLLQLISDQLDVDVADVYILNEDEIKMTCVGSIGFYKTPYKKVIPLEHLSFAQKVVTSGKPVKIADMRTYVEQEGIDPAVVQVLLEREKFKSFYGVPLNSKGKLLGVLEVFHREVIEHDETWVDFLLALADQAAIAISQAQLFDEMQKANQALTVAYDDTIKGWALALELRDNETQGHSLRVTELAVELAKMMGITGVDLVRFHRGAVLHDIGKMGVPDRILHKPKKLTDAEWEIMKKHPEYGYEMLSKIDFLQDSLDIPLYHHERWDGKGYPKGLKGEEIPLSARIFAIVDVWDAVTNDRPYHKAWSIEETLAYVKAQRGKHFDANVVDNFLKLIGVS